MSEPSKHGVRQHALAIATALVLTSSIFAGSAMAAGRVDLGGIDSASTHDRFIVKYRKGTLERNDQDALQRSLSAAGARTGQGVGIAHLRRLAVGAEVIKADRKLDRAEAALLMRQLAADPSVEYVEVDQLMQPILTPNDTRYSEQWGYFNATGGIKANEAWDVSTGTGQVVAVLDTGITNHSDLNANIIAGYDMISDVTVAGDGDGRDSNPADPGDYYNGQNSSWHGTHVAGTVAAVTNNASGVAGTAFNARVSPVRVLGRGGGYTSDIADGIIWASGGSVSGVPANANPAKVINMSLGGSGSCSSTYQNAINGAVSRGTTVVVAAGNSNVNVTNSVPANCSNVVAVAATDINGAKASFSNYGTGIDVSGPGVNILSTLNTGTTSPGSESYASYNGTSMAAPHVAGVVALMQAAVASAKSPADIESLLKSTARPLPGACSGGCGAGIVNAKAAVDAAKGDTTPPPSNTLSNGVTVSNLSASTGNSLNYTMSVPTGASNLKFVISGGTGDADMYVKFGSAPTDTSYDCRPYLSGNSETCSFTTPQVGTYYVRLKAYSSFSGVSLTGSYSTSTGSQTYTNSANYTINDNSTVESPISVSGRSGYASSTSKVPVDIKHTFRGDLQIDLVAPDGSLYLLKSTSSSDSTDNVLATYTVNLSSELLNGTWKLRVKDIYSGDTGYIDSWSLTF